MIILDALRFRFFVTVAMRAILIRDGVAGWGRASKAVGAAGNPMKRCAVMSGTRRLEAQLVVPTTLGSASVLILHGIGERLSYWNDAQQFLAEHDVAPLIIDYSGYGESEGAITPSNLRQDAIAGYTELQRLVPEAGRPFLLGLSLGTGIAVDAAPYLEPAPAGIILCEAFSSLRDAAASVCRRLPLPRHLCGFLKKLIPDLYRTSSSVVGITSPLMIAHSDADELFPVAMAREIFAAASGDAERRVHLAVVQSFAHNDVYLRPSAEYWRPILEFIRRSGNLCADARLDP